MTITVTRSDFTATFESFRAFAYPDPLSPLAQQTKNIKWGYSNGSDLLESLPQNIRSLSGAPWTIGYGETTPNNAPVLSSMVCTMEEARTWLLAKLQNLNNYFLSVLPSITQCENDALSDYAYNLGRGGFPVLISYLKNNDLLNAGLQFLNGFYADHVPSLSLLYRRISEYNLFSTGQYIIFTDNDVISSDLKTKLLNMNSSNSLGIQMINTLKTGA